MKRLFVLVLVLTLLAAVATPAYAAGGPSGKGGGGKGGGGGGGDGIGKGGKMPFALVGTITSLNSATHAVTVAVVSGNTLVNPYIGQNLTIQTVATTRFLLRNPDGIATPITYEDLAVGQNVSVNGLLAIDVWTASRVTVGADLACQP